MDYYLRTNTQSETDTALLAAGLVSEQELQDGPALLPIAGVYVSYIGAIPERRDIDDNIIYPGDTRFHTNIRVLIDTTPEQIALLPTVDPAPGIPYQVFA